MTPQPTFAPALSHLSPAPSRLAERPEQDPRSGPSEAPSRNFLLASAYQKLAASAERIEGLQARVQALLAKPSNSQLS